LIVVVPSGFAIENLFLSRGRKVIENQSPLLFLFILPGVNTVR
jgi:hypothetical protein